MFYWWRKTFETEGWEFTKSFSIVKVDFVFPMEAIKVWNFSLATKWSCSPFSQTSFEVAFKLFYSFNFYTFPHIFLEKFSKHVVKIVRDQNFKCDFMNILTPLCRPLVNILTSKVDNIRCARSFSTPFWGAAQLVGSVLFLVKPGSTGLAIVKFFWGFLSFFKNWFALIIFVGSIETV